MPRKISMPGYVDIIHRLRLDHSQRNIKQETGIHRTIIRKVQKLADQKGWLLAENPIPDESEIVSLLGAKPENSTRPHPLEQYKTEIEQWKKEGYSFVVIQELLAPKYKCDESTIRRMYYRWFPKPANPVMLRKHIPGEVMEVDFGYLGLCYDPTVKRKRKPIFVS